MQTGAAGRKKLLVQNTCGSHVQFGAGIHLSRAIHVGIEQ